MTFSRQFCLLEVLFTDNKVSDKSVAEAGYEPTHPHRGYNNLVAANYKYLFLIIFLYI